MFLFFWVCFGVFCFFLIVGSKFWDKGQTQAVPPPLTLSLKQKKKFTQYSVNFYNVKIQPQAYFQKLEQIEEIFLFVCGLQ